VPSFTVGKTRGDRPTALSGMENIPSEHASPAVAEVRGEKMRRLAVVVAALLAIGCSSHSGNAPSPSKISPDVFQKHGHAGWVHTALPNSNGHVPIPMGLAVDANHKVWAAVEYSDIRTGAIDKIAMDQHVTSYPLVTYPGFIVVGSDQNLWVTTLYANENPGVIARVTPNGVETDFKVAPGSYFANIVSGPDGALWFPECNNSNGTGGIGTITTSGTYTFYSSACQDNIASGSDGNIWFGNSPSISKMTTQGVVLAQYTVGDLYIAGMMTGADGALYMIGSVSGGGSDLIRVTTSGTVTHLGTNSFGDGLKSLANGPDGNLWMVGRNRRSNYLVSFDVSTQNFSGRFLAPRGYSFGQSLVAGPDGNVWASNLNTVDAYILQDLTLSPNPLTVAVGHTANLNASETNYSGQWTALSKKPSVASVTANSNNGTFVVTGVSVGTTFVTVYDTLFNSAAVKVTVH
jgi:streptogramin lyase